MPPTHESGSTLLSLGLEHAEKFHRHPQQQQQPGQRKSAAAAADSNNNSPRAKIAVDFPCDYDGGDGSILVRPHGEGGNKAAGGVAGTADTTAMSEFSCLQLLFPFDEIATNDVVGFL